jgi:hypothetical protein
MCGGALLVLLAWNITAQAVSAASMHLNRPQVACKVVLVNEVFSLGPGETKTIVEDLDVSHYDRIVYRMDATKLLNNFVRLELLFFQHSTSSCKAYIDVRPGKPNAVEVLSTNGLPKLAITIGTSSEGGKSTHDTVEVFASGCEGSSSSQKSKREKGERNESHWHCF